ncbi:MAG TPA: CcoQ/FixQ family Cbb3-type cytochrome c oxidase assembly chaperone [Candidatus Azoamicus sp. OHIO1]
MNISIFKGVLTIILMFMFFILVLWVYLPKNKHYFNHYSKLPFYENKKLNVKNHKNISGDNSE